MTLAQGASQQAAEIFPAREIFYINDLPKHMPLIIAGLNQFIWQVIATLRVNGYQISCIVDAEHLDVKHRGKVLDIPVVAYDSILQDQNRDKILLLCEEDTNHLAPYLEAFSGKIFSYMEYLHFSRAQFSALVSGRAHDLSLYQPEYAMPEKEFIRGAIEVYQQAAETCTEAQIERIFGEKSFVNIGAMDCKSHDPCYPFFQYDFKGIEVDAADYDSQVYKDARENLKGIDKAVFKFDTKLLPETTVEMLQEVDCPERFTLLKIDIDSFDFYILKPIIEAGYRPAMIQIEVSKSFPAGVHFAVKPAFENGELVLSTGKQKPGVYGYSGVSVSMVADFLAAHGYGLVGADFGYPDHYARQQDVIFCQQHVIKELVLETYTAKYILDRAPIAFDHMHGDMGADTQKWKMADDPKLYADEIKQAIEKAAKIYHGGRPIDYVLEFPPPPMIPAYMPRVEKMYHTPKTTNKSDGLITHEENKMTQDNGYQCKNGCGPIDLCPEFREFPRITSDGKPFKSGGEIGLCATCGLVQKPDTDAWRAEIAQIYGAYDMFSQSDDATDQAFIVEGGIVDQSRSAKLLSELKGRLDFPDTGHILDVGVGTGAFIRSFADLFPNWQYSAQDLSDRRLKNMSKVPGFQKLYTCHPREIEERFDVISLHHVLEHIPEPLGFLSVLEKLLKPRGKIIIQVPDVSHNIDDLLLADHCMHFDAASLINLAKNSSFAFFKLLDTAIPKQLTLVLQADAHIKDGGEVQTPPPQSLQPGPTDMSYLINKLRLKLQNIDRFKTDKRQIGIFGNASAATIAWCVLSGKASFFVDDDPTRVGNRHLGLPIYARDQIPNGAVVIVTLSPEATADKIVAELTAKSIPAYVVYE